MKILPLLALTASLWSVCSAPDDLSPSPAEADTLATGLAGRALLAAPCPGPLTDAPCPDQPLQAAFEVLDSTNAVVTRFESDAEGRFSVALQPGAYTIRPAASAPLLNPQMQRQAATVLAEGITPVTLRFDSGMR